MHNFLLMF